MKALFTLRILILTEKNTDIAGMSFEAGMAELESLVTRLEARDIGLEESLEAFERGHALQMHLNEKLKATELRIEKISNSAQPLEQSSRQDDELLF